MNIVNDQHPDAFMNAVYDLLIKVGGAHENLRVAFIQAHNDSVATCNEFRFGGKLGFGGKYWSDKNRVSYYPEDETVERSATAAILNIELRTLANKFGKSYPSF